MIHDSSDQPHAGVPSRLLAGVPVEWVVLPIADGRGVAALRSGRGECPFDSTPKPGRSVLGAASSPTSTIRDTMTSNIESLEALSQDYQASIPADLRQSRSFDWYLQQVASDPTVARNAHQRVADMFDYYGTEYDEDAAVVEYRLASEDPLHNG